MPKSPLDPDGSLYKRGVYPLRISEYRRLKRKAKMLNFLSAFSPFRESLDTSSRALLDNLEFSNSDNFQDLFVLHYLDYKRGGFFVEFGAADGVKGSNTYLLEKQYGWSGILAEPSRVWHEALKTHRTAIVETACVWSETGSQLSFNAHASGLSHIEGFGRADLCSLYEITFDTYTVPTISLDDLLLKYDAPLSIDYLSVDTEGSELDIMQSFSFRYRFAVIHLEVPGSAERSAFDALLEQHGYQRVFSKLSSPDVWYIASR
jgi:FkbM family methyltransferase